MRLKAKLIVLAVTSGLLLGCSNAKTNEPKVRAGAVADCVERNDWTVARCKNASDLAMICENGAPVCGEDEGRAAERCRVLVEQDPTFDAKEQMSCPELVGAFGLCPNGALGDRSVADACERKRPG